MFAFTAPVLLGTSHVTSLRVSRSSQAGPRMAISNPSPSVPFLPKPKNLDESMIGYAGFGKFNPFYSISSSNSPVDS